MKSGTASIGAITNLLSIFKELHKTGHTLLKIQWYYEDVQAGEHAEILCIEKVIGHPIEAIPKEIKVKS